MMTSLYVSFLFILVLVSCSYEAQSGGGNGVYIVYMGARRNNHDQLLRTMMKRNKGAVVQTYTNGFSGFAARLSEEEAKSMAGRPGVVSVFPDPVLHIHTTRSWDFLKYQTALKIDSFASNTSSSTRADTIIGILDTGIWPESKSFTDEDMGPIPATWKGKCMAGLNFTTSSCNKKIIGARYYDDPDSGMSSFGTPRDESGHGTHVASTAGGAPVSGASYYGLAKGTAAGGSPGSRIAMYRVCVAGGGCLGSAILKAFDDAIGDGVDVLSLSLGSSPGEPQFDTDPIAIGSFHAVEKGIIVACSAGNSGPSPASVVNVAPWILTVAATTIDRDFQADVVLGGNIVIKGGGINFSGLNKSTAYPLIDGRAAKSASGQHTEADAINCIPGALSDAQVKGKIVLCQNPDDEYDTKDKYDVLSDQGAVGMILIDDDKRQVPFKYGTSPIAAVTKDDGAQIQSYINSTANPTATILPTVVVENYKPAPAVAYFSSRGPTYGILNLLKPDIAAPGVAILASWPWNDTRESLPDKEAPVFNFLSGTSMACPHVSGLAASVKSQHPTWSASAIRSAIMTTAIQTNNLHGPIMTNSGSKATPYDIGAGEISVSGPLQPGLVYETETIDYIGFLCNLGYDTAKIRAIAATSLPNNFSCSTTASPDLISNLNYPSIAVWKLKENESKTINRTVTNVGEDETYTATVEVPVSGVISVDVLPKKLEFTKNVKKQSFEVTFKLAKVSKDALFFGSITWTSDKYKVRSPFVVNTV